jgi:hypothetical protein
MEELTTVPPSQAEPDQTEVAAETAPPVSRFEQGRRWFDEQGRPLHPAELLDTEFMSGWFHQWGFTDAMTQTPPLFSEFTPHPLGLLPYNEGYAEGRLFESEAATVGNIADAAFEQYCAAQGWDETFVQTYCGAAEEYLCDRDSITLMYALLVDPQAPPADSVPEGDESLYAKPSPEVAFGVKFDRVDGRFELSECIDHLAKDPIAFPVDRTKLPNPLTQAEVAELKVAELEAAADYDPID